MAIDNITIKMLDASSVHEQASVESWVFHKRECTEEMERIWFTKHYCNPLGNSIIFGAYDGDKLVGVKAYYPAEYIYKGQVVPVIVSCDSGVLEEYRGKGIWSELVTHAIQFIFQQTEYKTIISFPNHTNSYKGFQKLGWKTVAILKNYIWINNGKALMRSITSNSILIQLGVILNIFPLLTRLIAFVNPATEVTPCTHSEIVWKKNSDKMKIYLTGETLEWKIKVLQLHSIAVRRKGKIIATCLYKIDSFQGEKILKIYKISFADSVRQSSVSTIAKLLVYLRRMYPSIAYIRTWEMEPNKATPLKCNLFLPTTHTNPFIVQNKDNAIQNSWDISLFDLDY